MTVWTEPHGILTRMVNFALHHARKAHPGILVTGGFDELTARLAKADA